MASLSLAIGINNKQDVRFVQIMRLWAVPLESSEVILHISIFVYCVSDHSRV